MALLINDIQSFQFHFMQTIFMFKSVNMKKVLFLAILSSVLLLSSCDKDDEGQHTVKYHISSSSPMNVNYTDADGNLKTASNVTSSWTYSFNTPGNGRIVTLTINSTNGSDVSGSIDVDGQEAAQNNSTGSTSMTAQIP